VFLANAHVGHDCRIGEGVILSNNVMLGGHCQIGDFANIGGGAAAHQFVRIAACSVVPYLSG
jgi:UDP-N-acetylglucosamine acyltransferase